MVQNKVERPSFISRSLKLKPESGIRDVHVKIYMKRVQGKC